MTSDRENSLLTLLLVLSGRIPVTLKEDCGKCEGCKEEIEDQEESISEEMDSQSDGIIENVKDLGLNPGQGALGPGIAEKKERV